MKTEKSWWPKSQRKYSKNSSYSGFPSLPLYSDSTLTWADHTQEWENCSLHNLVLNLLTKTENEDAS